MQYFMFSPLDFTEEQAHRLAKPSLRDHHIVHVTTHGNEIVPPAIGKRPTARRGCYLVRVEPDGSTRLIQRAL